MKFRTSQTTYVYVAFLASELHQRYTVNPLVPIFFSFQLAICVRYPRGKKNPTSRYDYVAGGPCSVPGAKILDAAPFDRPT